MLEKGLSLIGVAKQKSFRTCRKISSLMQCGFPSRRVSGSYFQVELTW